MAVPLLTPLPTPPLASDPEEIFDTKAGATLVAQKMFVDEMNAETIPGINGLITSGEASVAAAAASALESAGYAQTSSDFADNSAVSAAEALASEQAAALTAENLATLDALWLGAAAADPTTGKTGAPLVAGNAYVNTVTGLLRAYNGVEWVQGVSVVAGVSAVAGLVGDITLEQLNTAIRPRTQARILSFF